MAWIESHDELPSHPKTRKAARKLGVNAPTVIGHLHVLWYWCLTFAPDGRLEGMDADDVADAAQWDGDPDTFANALTAAGWLDDDAGTLVVHDWWDGAGKTILRRRNTTKRQRERRARQADSDEHVTDDEPDEANKSRDSHDDVTRDTRGSNTPDRDRDRSQTQGDADAPPSPVDLEFEDFWNRYPRHSSNGKPGGGGSRKKAHQRWWRMTKAERQDALAAVDNYRKWVESPEGEYAAHATTWLNEARWEQWQEPAAGTSSGRFVGGVPKVQ